LYLTLRVRRSHDTLTDTSTGPGTVYAAFKGIAVSADSMETVGVVFPNAQSAESFPNSHQNRLVRRLLRKLAQLFCASLIVSCISTDPGTLVRRSRFATFWIAFCQRFLQHSSREVLRLFYISARF